MLPMSQKSLKPMIDFTIRQDMYSIMTSPAKSDAIRYLNPKCRGIFPRFNVMDYQETGLKLFIALLTFITIPFKTSVSPSKIKLAMKPALELLTRCKFSECIIMFSLTLLLRSKLVATNRSTESSFMSIILVAPKRLTASFTILIETCFPHGIILSQESI